MYGKWTKVTLYSCLNFFNQIIIKFISLTALSEYEKLELSAGGGVHYHWSLRVVFSLNINRRGERERGGLDTGRGAEIGSI